MINIVLPQRKKLSSLSRSSKGFTLLELMMAILVAVPMMVSMFVAFIYVLQVQATVSDQSFVRMNTDIAIQRLQQDIRNTSSGMYNSNAFQLRNPLTGGVGHEGESQMQLLLADTANGQEIRWVFDRENSILSRHVIDLTVVGASEVTTDYVRMPFSDLVFDEVRLSEYSTPLAPNGQNLLGSNGEIIEDDEDYITPSSVVAIEIKGRTLHRLSPKNTIWKEIDVNSDADLRDDTVGAELFGRTDSGDQPKWQYIYNVTTTLRNS